AGQQQAKAGQGDRPDHDAVQEQRAGGPGHVIAEHRERMGERMAAAAIGQDTGHADDHSRDQEDEPDNDDHDVLRESELQISVEEGSPEFSPCLSRGVSPPPARVPKNPEPATVSADIARAQLPRSGAILLYYASAGPHVKETLLNRA